MNDPIVINNRDRLTTTKKLVKDLNKLGYTNVIILDNDSSYPPLLQWYEENPCRVVRLLENMGQLAIFNSGLINEWVSGSWIGYTDSDIELNPNTPPDFLQTLQKIGDKYGVNKVGLALRIDDIPDNTENQRWVKQWEARFWEYMIEPLVFRGEVDTTFGIIKVGQPFQYHALRVGGDLTCRHIPWYHSFEELDEEETYYLDHCSPVSTYKRTYDQWKANKEGRNLCI